MDPKPRPEPVTYVCGECGQESTQNLVPGETIKCPSCLFGVLYKKRTRKIVQFEAR